MYRNEYLFMVRQYWNTFFFKHCCTRKHFNKKQKTKCFRLLRYYFLGFWRKQKETKREKWNEDLLQIVNNCSDFDVWTIIAKGYFKSNGRPVLTCATRNRRLCEFFVVISCFLCCSSFWINRVIYTRTDLFIRIMCEPFYCRITSFYDQREGNAKMACFSFSFDHDRTFR